MPRYQREALRLRVAAAFLAEALARAAAGREAAASPPSPAALARRRGVHGLASTRSRSFLPPPVSLFTVAQARRSASLFRKASRFTALFDMLSLALLLVGIFGICPRVALRFSLITASSHRYRCARPFDGARRRNAGAESEFRDAFAGPLALRPKANVSTHDLVAKGVRVIAERALGRKFGLGEDRNARRQALEEAAPIGAATRGSTRFSGCGINPSTRRFSE